MRIPDLEAVIGTAYARAMADHIIRELGLDQQPRVVELKRSRNYGSPVLARIHPNGRNYTYLEEVQQRGRWEELSKGELPKMTKRQFIDVSGELTTYVFDHHPLRIGVDYNREHNILFVFRH